MNFNKQNKISLFGLVICRYINGFSSYKNTSRILWNLKIEQFKLKSTFNSSTAGKQMYVCNVTWTFYNHLGSCKRLRSEKEEIENILCLRAQHFNTCHLEIRNRIRNYRMLEVYLLKVVGFSWVFYFREKFFCCLDF